MPPPAPARGSLLSHAEAQPPQLALRPHSPLPAGGTRTMQASTGSATQTQTQTDPTPTIAVLRLRGAHDASIDSSPRRSIRWAEDVVDNEGLGRKSSKVCCIYHAPRAVGESSSESDSSDSSSDDSSSASDPDSEIDTGEARMVGGGKSGRGKAGGKRRRHGHGHSHGPRGKRNTSPNAYERMPKSGKAGGQGGGDAVKR